MTEMGGKVAKKLGDGLMAIFGYPVAQENDAERAVRAALSIQRALAELNRKNAGSGKPVLAARVAIDLGPVVVDATGEIFGDVSNIAARAQALAEPGAVVVPRGCSARSPGCSSRKSVAATNSKACRSRWHCSGWSAPAAAAAALGRASSRRSSAVTRKWRC